MAQKNKALPYIIFGVPLAIGIYFILKSLKNKKGQDAPSTLPSDANSDVEPTTKGGGTSAITKYFPLKRGSKGAKVEELQNAILSYDATLLPKFGADKDFGAETESAVKKLLNKTTIDSQEDINKILGLKVTQANQQALANVNTDRFNLGSKLSTMKFKNNNLSWSAIHDVSVIESDITSDGRAVNPKSFIYHKGTKVKEGNSFMTIVEKSGFITYKVDGKKQYQFSPYGFQLV